MQRMPTNELGTVQVFIKKVEGLEKLQDFSLKTKTKTKTQDHSVKTKTKTQDFLLKTKTKTFFQVVEAPRDQDHVLEDYSTGFSMASMSPNKIC